MRKDDLTEAAMSRLSEPLKISPNDPLRELFEACKCGDLAKVRGSFYRVARKLFFKDAKSDL